VANYGDVLNVRHGIKEEKKNNLRNVWAGSGGVPGS